MYTENHTHARGKGKKTTPGQHTCSWEGEMEGGGERKREDRYGDVVCTKETKMVMMSYTLKTLLGMMSYTLKRQKWGWCRIH